MPRSKTYWFSISSERVVCRKASAETDVKGCPFPITSSPSRSWTYTKMTNSQLLFDIARTLKHQTNAPTQSSKVKLQYLAPYNGFQRYPKNAQGTWERTNSEIPKDPRWLHFPLPIMHGESLLHTFLILRDRFQRQKSEVCSVFRRRGHLPSGDYFRVCLPHRQRSLPSAPRY